MEEKKLKFRELKFRDKVQLTGFSLVGAGLIGLSLTVFCWGINVIKGAVKSFRDPEYYFEDLYVEEDNSAVDEKVETEENKVE